MSPRPCTCGHVNKPRNHPAGHRHVLDRRPDLATLPTLGARLTAIWKALA